MDPEELKTLLKSGIEAARNNNTVIARHIFQQVVDADPQNELAWMWLAQVAETTAERRQCLERVLALNPLNEKAKSALQKLTAGTATLSSPTTPRTEPVSRPRAAQPVASPKLREPSRDTLQPVQRREAPRELWETSRRERSRLGYWLIGTIAVSLIGLALVLLVLRLTGDEEAGATPTPAEAAVVATPEPPTSTSTPRRIAPPVTPAVIPPNVLPPTWTPSPPPTLLPSPTWTAAPPGLNTYTLVFSGNRVPGDPFELFVVQADGSGLRPLLLTLPPLETPEVQPAAAQESTEEAAPAEAEETAPLPETGTPTVQLLDPAFSPDGRSIAFTGQVGDIQELYVVGYPNGTPRQLTRLGAKRTVGASWAPDGDSILVASNADGDFDIYQVDSRGDAPLKNLTNNEGFDDVDPSWSPDGKYIAFASDRLGKGALEIFVMPLEGSDVCQMTESTNSSFAPNWSHDGQAILFISNRNTDNDLFIMRSDGSDERLLSLNDKDWEEREPTWSPDQRWIVLSSNWEDSPTTTLWLASPDGAEWKRVVNGEGEGRDASWLPGGETVSLPPDFQFRCAR